ncbi:RagB/SusD family nutrient uptake outer membrane protein [Roseivirga pacifica]
MLKRLFAFTMAVCLCLSCHDDLDQFPETGILTENYYNSQESVESTVTASYNNLQGLYSYYMILWGEVTSDNAYVQAPNSNGGVSSLEDFTWSTTTGFVNSIWNSSYDGIFHTNMVLEVIDEVQFSSSEVKNVRRGEVLFIRSFLYDNLTTIYGDVPLLTKVTDPSYAFDDTRTPKAEVYDQIEADLLEAIDLLPVTNAAGRADKQAARAILAKNYMKRGMFAQAAQQLQQIVGTGKYLLVDIGDLYGVENEGNAEDVFSIQYASELDGNSEGSAYYYNFTQPDNQGGRGAMAMEPAFYNLFDAADKRRDLINVSDNAYYANKWTPSPNNNTGDGGDNHYVVRYADVLLMLAEALNETGGSAEALNYLNEVRNRAGLSGITSTNQAVLRDAIALERRFELFGEGHRWADLLRSGNAVSTMNNFFASEGKNIVVQDFRVLAPIPQSQVDITAMQQNPGY